MSIVSQNKDGTWVVKSTNRSIIQDNLSNAKAWRVADRIDGEPISAKEAERDVLSGENANLSKITEQEFYSALLSICDNKGRNVGWAAHKFKAKFGAYPSGLSRKRGPVHKSVSFFLLNLSREKGQ